MKKSKSVQELLDELAISDPKNHQIVKEVRAIFLAAQKLEEKVMYGGIIFSLNEVMLGGVFSYKNHVSVEFSEGFRMEDPQKYLEGGGKYRRHLKIPSPNIIQKKDLAAFVDQALKLVEDL